MRSALSFLIILFNDRVKVLKALALGFFQILVDLSLVCLILFILFALIGLGALGYGYDFISEIILVDILHKIIVRNSFFAVFSVIVLKKLISHFALFNYFGDRFL